jgi:drug/metabolite transporter (DMT)-like permease
VTAALLLIVFLSECSTVAGQLFMKHAMTQSGAEGFRRKFATAIFCMAVGFFLWLTVMGHVELSYLYPFEALNRLLVVAGAIVFLKEKLTPALWLGVVLISAGVVLVSAS